MFSWLALSEGFLVTLSFWYAIREIRDAFVARSSRSVTRDALFSAKSTWDSRAMANSSQRVLRGALFVLVGVVLPVMAFGNTNEFNSITYYQSEQKLFHFYHTLSTRLDII